MSIFGHRLYPGLEIHAPVIGRKKHVFFVSHITPYHKAIQQTICGINLGLCTFQVELTDTVDNLAHTFRVHADPQHVVFRADQPCEALIAFNYTAEDRKIRMQRYDRFRPRRRVPLKTVSHACDLIVASLRVTSSVVWVIELESFELVNCVGLKVYKFRHRGVELLAHYRTETGLDNHYQLNKRLQ